MGLSEPALSLTDLALGIVVIALAVLLQRTPGRAPLLAPHVLVGRRGRARGGGPPRRRDLLRHLGRPELGGHQHDGRGRGLLPARGQRRRGPRPGPRARLLGAPLRGPGRLRGAGDRRLRGGERDPRVRGDHDDRDPGAVGPRAARPQPAGGARDRRDPRERRRGRGRGRSRPPSPTWSGWTRPRSTTSPRSRGWCCSTTRWWPLRSASRGPRRRPPGSRTPRSAGTADLADGPSLRFHPGGCPSPPPPPRAT